MTTLGFGLDIILAGFSAFFSFILTLLAGYLAWRAKSIIQEIKRNTAARKFLLGDGELHGGDTGYRDEVNENLNEIREKMDAEHIETRERLERIEEGLKYLTSFVRNLASAINESEISQSIEEPNAFDPPDHTKSDD